MAEGLRRKYLLQILLLTPVMMPFLAQAVLIDESRDGWTTSHALLSHATGKRIGRDAGQACLKFVIPATIPKIQDGRIGLEQRQIEPFHGLLEVLLRKGGQRQVFCANPLNDMRHSNIRVSHPGRRAASARCMRHESCLGCTA